MKKYFSLAILLCASVLSGCDYEKNAVQDITGSLPASRIKFFNFSVGSPGVNFYANSQKMTAVQSTTGIESTTGTVYGGAGNGSGSAYSAIDPGSYTVTGKIAAATDKDLAVASLQTTIADAKFYSYYMSGTYNTATKTTDSFIVEDVIPTQDFTVAYVRLVNASANSSPMQLFAKNTLTGVELPVGAAIAYQGAGAFTSIPNGVYDLSTRTAGSSTNVIVRTGVSFSAGRVYTIGARGTIAGTGTAVPALDNTVNR
ncbi:MAG: DUF4397 domain-containing protein [Gemmatimonadaceae bacterium]|nr:DUF4397 domain-containing protein [Gemmatimonadaceae bacterium]